MGRTTEWLSFELTTAHYGLLIVGSDDTAQVGHFSIINWVLFRSTRTEAWPEPFYYIERFYNRRRLHSSLDYLSQEAHDSSIIEKRSPLNPLSMKMGEHDGLS